MIIPIKTSYQRRHMPWVNYALVGANILLYFLGYNADTPQGSQRIAGWMLQPDFPALEQFFTCMFLHASLAHLLGNMVFLFVFGNAVNDKLGHLGYLAFYLAGGILAGVGYLLLSGQAPVLGASGAIAAVVGAYLVLLPNTSITLIIWMFIIFPVQVSSLYFIMIQFVFELFMTARGWAGPASTGVAYAAHSTGYIFGIAVALLLLLIKALPRDDFDLLHLLNQRRRRRKYQKIAGDGYNPFGLPIHRSRTVKTRTACSDVSPASPQEQALRDDIMRALGNYDLPAAARLYRESSEVAKNLSLPLQGQLDIANQLMAEQHYAQAAMAYEVLVSRNRNYEYLPDIYLMLGLLYGRYLNANDKAQTCLALAVSKLSDPQKRQMAENELITIQQKQASS